MAIQKKMQIRVDITAYKRYIISVAKIVTWLTADKRAAGRKED